MRNSTSGSTPKTNTVQDDSVSNNNAEKTSAKKLKQARLPFKVIAPGTSPVGSKTTATPLTTAGDKDKDAIKDSHSTDGRKRKLSYDDTDEDVGGGATVVLDADDNVSKENVEILKAATKKKKTSNNDNTTAEIVSLLDDDDDEEDDEAKANNVDVANCSVISAVGKKDLKTPKAKDKRNGAGTPQTSSAQKDKNGSASKLQIKLPLSAGKKKRRKSKLHQLNNSTTEGTHNHSAQEFSSDDIEEIAIEQNPQKRKKLNAEYDVDEDGRTKAKSKCDDQEQEVETIALDSEPEEEAKEVEEVKSKTSETKPDTKSASRKENLKKESSKKASEQSIKNWTVNKTASKEKETEPEINATKNTSTEKLSEDEDQDQDEVNQISSSSDEEKMENHKDEELDESVLSDNDNEADDERDNLTGKAANISSDMSENSKSKLNNTLEPHKDGKSTNSTSKNQTPKQAKLMEQRRKAREEKERKLQEEKEKKQQEKEERELAKKREREEKEEQRRKEREEKEEQRRKERDEKERKRLAELEVKNEEKRKKNEAKEEELRKKEEERKRKEQEKEEAELKKKKAAQAFTKFFVAKTPNQAQLKNEEDSNTGDDNKQLAFRPFQVKGDMKLAPIVRKIFTEDEKHRLDNLLGCRNDHEEEEDVVRRKPLAKSQLYLSELRSGKILPGKWRRPSTESKDDVILVEDELERVGQEIKEDTPAYVREEMRVKFYKFHDNRRPPYYGTWRKKSSVVKPRKPFAQDKKFFDYEVDSDDEWEEEEPGESLEDGSDDDKEKESEDDDYEVDNEWFVPHGHLSDEELQNEDEFGMGDDNTREAQKAKLQILQQEFAQEMKKKTEKIKPRLIGCIWTDINGNQPPECARILWDTLEKKAMLFTEPPLVEEPEGDRSAEPSSSPSGATNGNAEKPNADKLKPISLSENMIKDLTRLLHGNNHSKNFLINEFIAYIEKTEESVKNGDLRKPLKSVVRDKIDEMAEWQAIDATASTLQEIEQSNDDTAATDSTKKKKKGKRRLCWVVKQEMLNKVDLSSLELQNSWEYTLPPKFVKSDKDVKTDETESTSTTAAVAEDSAKGKNTAATSQITKFTKVLTAEEKASKLQNSPASSTNTSSTDKSGGTETKSNTPTTSKEKKRVPLLMSVARGQQIPTPAKNKLISQFLQQKGKDNVKPSSSPTTSRSKTVISPQVEDDDDVVVILD